MAEMHDFTTFIRPVHPGPGQLQPLALSGMRKRPSNVAQKVIEEAKAEAGE